MSRSRTNANNWAADITAVQAGTGISVTNGTGPTPTVINSMATAIDAKGDLVAGTGADAFTRLAVGSNGQFLAANSSTSTGLEWVPAPSAGANWTLVNPGGTSLSGSSTSITGISNADKILVIVSAASTNTTQSEIGVRVNSITTSDYYRSGFYINPAASYNAANFAATAGTLNTIELGLMSTSGTSSVSGAVTLTGCNAAGVKQFISTGGTEPSGGNGHQLYSWQGYVNTSSVITSVQVRTSSGSFDQGTVFVYVSA